MNRASRERHSSHTRAQISFTGTHPCRCYSLQAARSKSSGAYALASLIIIRFLSSPFAPCSVPPATPSTPSSAEDTSVARQRLSLQLPSYHCNYPTQRPRGLKHSAQARVRTPVPVRLQGMGGSDSLREPWRTKRESYLSSGHTTHLQVVEGADCSRDRAHHMLPHS